MTIFVASLLLVALLVHVTLERSRRGEPIIPRRPASFFLWDRSAGAKLVGFSYAASMVSAFVFIPLPGLFYTHGVGGWLFVCLPVIAGCSALTWFAPRLRRLSVRMRDDDAVSPFEAIGNAYGSRKLGAVLFVYSMLFVIPLIAMQVVGFGRLLEGYGLPYTASVFGLVGVFLLYTAIAGMEGDVKTDVWQAVAMLVGLFIAATVATSDWFALPRADRAIPLAAHATLPGPEGFFTLESLASVAVVMFALPLVNGHYMMRFTVAKDDESLLAAARIAPCVILGFYLFAAVIGLLGAAVLPGLESGDQLTGALLGQVAKSNVLGEIVAGVVIFGVMSASLSSVDSQFLALGAGASRDVFRNLIGVDLTPNQQVLVSRAVMVTVGFAAVLMALSPPRLVIQLAILSASGALLLAPAVVAGVFHPDRLSVRSAYASVALGAVSFFAVQFGFRDGSIGPLSAALASFSVAAIAFLLVETVERFRLGSTDVGH